MPLAATFALAMAIIGPTHEGHASGCKTIDVVQAEQKHFGTVVGIAGDAAQKLADVLWANSEGGPPTVDQLLVVYLTTGSVSIIPVLHGLVCVAEGLSVTPERMAVAQASAAMR